MISLPSVYCVLPSVMGEVEENRKEQQNADRLLSKYLEVIRQFK